MRKASIRDLHIRTSELVREAAEGMVILIERRGEAVALACSDSDTALRALLAAYPAAHDIEVRGAGLEEAFLELVAEDEEGLLQ